jgi:hypothetical protein
VTQPFAELVKGLSDEDALAFLKALDDLSQKSGFAPNVGPAMLRDNDDPAAMNLLARALASYSHLNASAVIADDDGIHWKTIGEAAKLVRYLTDHSARSQGNFQFTASAMLKPLGPFYPGAYHTGAGRQFSLGFEGANIVQEVFGRTHGDFDASVTELTRQPQSMRVGERGVWSPRRMDFRCNPPALRLAARSATRSAPPVRSSKQRDDDCGARDHHCRRPCP